MASLTLCSLLACASTKSNFPKTPADVTSGSKRVLVNVPDVITRGDEVTVGYMLTGHPNLYPNIPLQVSLCVVSLNDNDCTVDWVNPHIARYYAYTLSGRYTLQIKHEHVVIHVELRKFKGYDILGQPHASDEPFLRGAKLVTVRDMVAGGPLGIHQTQDRLEDAGGQ